MSLFWHWQRLFQKSPLKLCLQEELFKIDDRENQFFASIGDLSVLYFKIFLVTDELIISKKYMKQKEIGKLEKGIGITLPFIVVLTYIDAKWKMINGH